MQIQGGLVALIAQGQRTSSQVFFFSLSSLNCKLGSQQIYESLFEKEFYAIQF
jgi:hypothetical protein